MSDEAQEKAAALAARWKREEKSMREILARVEKAGGSADRLKASKSTLRACRLQLRREFGLPDEPTEEG